MTGKSQTDYHWGLAWHDITSVKLQVSLVLALYLDGFLIGPLSHSIGLHPISLECPHHSCSAFYGDGGNIYSFYFEESVK